MVRNSHGEQVINILAGSSFGVARSPNIKIIPVRGTKKNPNDEASYTLWKGALSAIAKHFEAARQQSKVSYGVLNCSRALEKTGNVELGFKECVDAGIIMVGAAGNRAVSVIVSAFPPIQIKS